MTSLLRHLGSSTRALGGASAGGLTFPAFPYEPYGIQRDFMAAVYRQLDRGGVGLFESPTGRPDPNADMA